MAPWSGALYAELRRTLGSPDTEPFRTALRQAGLPAHAPHRLGRRAAQLGSEPEVGRRLGPTVGGEGHENGETRQPPSLTGRDAAGSAVRGGALLPKPRGACGSSREVRGGSHWRRRARARGLLAARRLRQAPASPRARRRTNLAPKELRSPAGGSSGWSRERACAAPGAGEGAEARGGCGRGRVWLLAGRASRRGAWLPAMVCKPGFPRVLHKSSRK